MTNISVLQYIGIITLKLNRYISSFCLFYGAIVVTLNVFSCFCLQVNILILLTEAMLTAHFRGKERRSDRPQLCKNKYICLFLWTYSWKILRIIRKIGMEYMHVVTIRKRLWILLWIHTFVLRIKWHGRQHIMIMSL